MATAQADVAGSDSPRLVFPALAVIGSLFSVGAARADIGDLLAQGKYCSATAQALFQACGHQARDDFLIAFAVCINESDAQDRAECFQDARDSQDEDVELCGDQLAGRRDACGGLGEERYDPEFEESNFDRDFTNLTNPNPYFPLGIGNSWQFLSQEQSTRVEVLNRTKLIDDVRCIVVRDEVREDGNLIERTNDWYAQAKNGNVWYCGEETGSYETFRGDNPRLPELVSIEGSFKAGREGDKPGIIFRANPTKGEMYVEEASLGNAEDATVVLAVDYAYGKYPKLDQLVPRRLAEYLCHGDCVVTRNFSLLEPGVFERKYYAPGIGVFLEVEPDSGEIVRLVKCNVDPRCAGLPQPP
jgi:hypothetical protein